MSIRDRIRRWLEVELTENIGLAFEDILRPMIRELRERDTELQAAIDGLSLSLDGASKGLRQLIHDTSVRLDRHREGVATAVISLDARLTSFANLLDKPKPAPRRKAKT